MTEKRPDTILRLEKIIGCELTQVETSEIEMYSQAFCINKGEITGLNLHANITDLSPLSSITSLNNLNLSYNQLTDLSPLTKLNGLIKLNLDYNKITDLSPLTKLTRLTKLYLGKNQLIDLSPLSELTKLTNLYLYENRINDLSPLASLDRLICLDLRHNQLTKLSSLSRLTGLTELSLEYNQITDLLPLSQLTNLNYLDLRRNQITDLSPLSRLIGLTKLNVEYNQIANLSPLSQLTKLTHLSLKRNKITDLSSLSQLTNLTNLDLRRNQITNLVPLSQLTELTYLDLKRNHITDLSHLSSLTKLNELNLGYNKLTDLSPLSRFTKLIKLWLANNYISDLSVLSHLTQLTHLDLRSNKITSLSPLAPLTALTVLGICNNKITNLSSLSSLLKLTFLDLRNNQITHLPSQFLRLNVTLKWAFENEETGVFLAGNPIESPPVEILKQGCEAIRSYFKQLKEEVQLLQCKLLIVGSGEVGKTTLMKKLKNHSFIVEPGKEPTTHGINIEPWEIPCPLPNCKGNEIVKTFFWDFGGQDIYHTTHQFFLTKRSLYILVWDARREEEVSHSFDYWLNVIKLLGSCSPTIVVMNKSDERTQTIDETTLKRKYPNIVAFHKISCLTGNGLGELVLLIKNTLSRMPHLKDKLPGSWLHIRNELKAMNENYIHASLFFKICSQHSIKDIHANTLADYLHDLGAILFFRNDPLLAETVILKPEWATQAVYSLLGVTPIIENNGSFQFQELKQYLDSTLYPPNLHPQLLRLMEKFELCFNFIQTYNYFIPELLSGDPLEFNQSPYHVEGSLHFQYKYEFMPKGIFSRFISRSYYLIHENRFWKYGVELKFDKSYALVSYQPLNSFIQIHITGSNKNELLAILRSHFNHIHETLNMVPGKHFHEMIPCPCTECTAKIELGKSFCFAYSTLLKFREKGYLTVPCNISCLPMKIEDLLNGFEPAVSSHDILKSLIDSSIKLIGLSKSMKSDEDSRTGFLCVLLNEKGFIVKDQTRWGQSVTGISMGRLDAKIQSPDGQEAILEAFKLYSFNAKVIELHALKIFKYDPIGLRNNFMVVYCDCENSAFLLLWKKYKEYIESLSYEFPIMGKLKEEESRFPVIKIARAIHKRYGHKVGITHLFLHTGT